MKGRFGFQSILLSLFLLLLSGCTAGKKEAQDGSSSSVTKAKYFSQEVVSESRKALETKLNKLALPNPITGIDTLGLTADEQAAMEFVYAYMITPDMLDYPVSFHLAQIRSSLRAMEELPWGGDIPADLFRHFVLPLRVNNEALDDFRTTYYDELKEVVAGLNMRDAVLALNHWCHRHVTYAPSDERTLSPRATLRNALGRCGEESTFAVAVLRTMGIPARQVYTPRWAHTDSNHAWVEAWVDGQWYYLGACEPSAVLDHAWFDAPVLRAMLLHTKVFGPYNGAKEVLSVHPTYTEVNVSEKYVPTAMARVRVVDPSGKPCPDVRVTFRIYNSAELFPVVSRRTNEDGIAETELGLGDVIVVAGNTPDLMGIGKVSVSAQDHTPTDIVLKPITEWDDAIHYRITPPVERSVSRTIEASEDAANTAQMLVNDSIRMSYVATFPTLDQSTSLAAELMPSGKEQERSQLRDIIFESRGNREVVEQFVRGVAADERHFAVALLASLTEKDLHDIPLEVLQDAFEAAKRAARSDIQRLDPEVISPRVVSERIYSVGARLEEALKEIFHRAGADEDWHKRSYKEQVTLIAQAVDSLRVDTEYNPIRQPLSPLTVWYYGMGDTESLKVLLIRLVRTAGIPAVWDRAMDRPVYRDEQNQRHLIPYRQSEESAPGKPCTVSLTYTPDGALKTPRYGNHFSIEHVTPDGQLSMYEFPWGAGVRSFKQVNLLYDHNFIATGQRLADGSVLYSLSKIRCGSDVPVAFDKDTAAVAVIGTLDPEMSYYNETSSQEQTILATTGRGYFILVLGRPFHEPTDHILRDMRSLIGSNGAPLLPIVVLTRGKDGATEAMKQILPEAHWGRDVEGRIEQMLTSGCEIDYPADLPLVVIGDTFGRVVFLSRGYTVGIGDRIAHTIQSIQAPRE